MIKRRVLVVAAHPDDEVLGCGGTISNLTKKGANVSVLIISDGIGARDLSKSEFKKEIKIRRNDCRNACKILGVRKLVFKNFPDNKLDTVPLLSIIKEIDEVVKKFKPDTVFTHCADDLNIDHHLVNKAVVTACRPQKRNSVKTLLFFEIPSSTEWQITKKKNHFFPNWYEDISGSIKNKIKALKLYKKELRKWPHPRSLKGIKTLAEWRGASSGYKAAEAFMLGRKK